MNQVLFLQSDIQDPYSIYFSKRKEQPIHWSAADNLWVIYSHKDCQYLLNEPAALVPGPAHAHTDALNEHTLLILNNLVRLSNPPAHTITRQVVMQMFGKMNPVNVTNAMDELLAGINNEFDWVQNISKQLPALLLLKGFGFNRNDVDTLLPVVETLTKIMQPIKTMEAVTTLNKVSTQAWHVIENHLYGLRWFNTLVNMYGNHMSDLEAMRSCCISNLIGFLIQSYDAGRGLLSNTLLQALRQQTPPDSFHDVAYAQKFVTETLRYDSPVHNTRRIASSDITVWNTTIREGEMMLLVLASANRDACRFEQPEWFNINRSNNNHHLTFGEGAHQCVARHFSPHITAEALVYLFRRFRNIRLCNRMIVYEPLVNARLPKELVIAVQ